MERATGAEAPRVCRTIRLLCPVMGLVSGGTQDVVRTPLTVSGCCQLQGKHYQLCFPLQEEMTKSRQCELPRSAENIFAVLLNGDFMLD